MECKYSLQCTLATRFLLQVLCDTPYTKATDTYNVLEEQFKENKITSQAVDAMWERIESKFTELCKGQANQAWFTIRKGEVSSTTAKAIMFSLLPDSKDIADEQLKVSIMECKSFLAKEDKEAQEKKEEKKAEAQAAKAQTLFELEAKIRDTTGIIRISEGTYSKKFSDDELTTYPAKYLICILEQLNLSRDKRNQLVKSHYGTNPKRKECILEKQGTGVVFGIREQQQEERSPNNPNF